MQILSAPAAMAIPEPEKKSFGAERTEKLINELGTPNAARPGMCSKIDCHTMHPPGLLLAHSHGRQGLPRSVIKRTGTIGATVQRTSCTHLIQLNPVVALTHLLQLQTVARCMPLLL